MSDRSRKSALKQLTKQAQVDWSKQDTDLDALRDLPDLQAYYKEND